MYCVYKAASMFTFVPLVHPRVLPPLLSLVSTVHSKTPLPLTILLSLVVGTNSERKSSQRGADGKKQKTDKRFNYS